VHIVQMAAASLLSRRIAPVAKHWSQAWAQAVQAAMRSAAALKGHGGSRSVG
jgi:hypothetical protein